MVKIDGSALTGAQSGDRVGASVAALGDLDHDGRRDLALGAAERAGPSPDFTVLQSAVDAAASGDMLLVRSGSYSDWSISGKALAIVAERTARAHIVGAGDILGLSSSQCVALRGLQLYSLGTNTLYHRLNRGLDVRFPAVRVEELAAPQLTPALETMMREGAFNVRE
jgi:hypothetical protein